MSVRVLIADDHKVVADGLWHLLAAQDDIEVVGRVGTGREAVNRAAELKPDVIVMDSNMPDLNGIEAARIIRERWPDTRVLMLSVQSDPLHAVRALRAGAAGYVPKSSAGIDVVEAVRTVSAGKRYVHPSMAEAVLARLVESAPIEDPLARLSARERQVLQLVVEGKGLSDIASSLSLSTRTVETYRARMMEKLGIHDVPGLVKIAILHGLTTLE